MLLGIDVDDILMPCVPLALEMANRDYGYNLTSDMVRSWGVTGTETDVIFQYFHTEFYIKQPVFPGAQDFVSTLIHMGHEIILITDVPVGCADARIKRLHECFPMIPAKNILVGARKDICHVDVLLDDAPHNYFDAGAKYPVLFRRPWNAFITGGLSVSSYGEFLTLVQKIEHREYPQKPSMLVLVGPTGSEKNGLAEGLCQNPKFMRPKSTTTNPKADPKFYEVVPESVFLQMRKNDYFFETSSYAGYFYGLSKAAVNAAIKQNRILVFVLDVSGAFALKSKFEDVMTIFVKVPRDIALKRILHRNISEEEKYQRIISMSDEYKNESICDISVSGKEHAFSIFKSWGII